MNIPIRYEPSQFKLLRIRSDWAGNFRCYWLDTGPLRAHYPDDHVNIIDDFPHLDDDRINVGVSDGRFDDPPF